MGDGRRMRREQGIGSWDRSSAGVQVCMRTDWEGRGAGHVTWQLACCMGKGTVVVVNGLGGAWGRLRDT